MQCNLPSFEELKNLVKNRKAFIPVVDNATQADVVRALDFTRQHFALTEVDVDSKDKGDDKRRYTVRDQMGSFATKTFLNWRVSDRINKLFRKGKTESQVDNIRNNPDNIIKRDFGTHVHSILEQLSRHFDTGESSVDAIWKSVSSSEFKLTKPQFDVLVTNAQKLVRNIKRQQARIDKNGKVEIRFEQVLIDPIQDVGGTMDIVAIFSDNTAMIYDFKTLSVWDQYIDKNRQLVSNEFISQSKRDQWKLQMSSYRRILLKHYGVREVRGSRIVPIWLDFKSTKDGVQKALHQLQMGEEMSEFLRTVLAGYEKTGVAVVDAFLKTQYNNLDNLYKKFYGADRSERADIMIAIRSTESAIQDFIEKNELEDLVISMYQQALAIQNKLNSNQEISDTELNGLIDYFEGVSNFQQGVAQNRTVLSNYVDPAFTEKIVEDLNQFNEHLTVINQVLGALVYHRLDSILNRIGDRYGAVRRQGSEVLLDDDSYLRKLFLSGSESTNPFIRYAIERIQQKYGTLRNDLIGVDSRIDTVEQDLIPWLRARGQTLADVHRYLLDESGNFHRQLSKEFYELRKQALEKSDVSFFTKYMEIKPQNSKGETYEQWYARSEKEFKSFLQDRFQYLITRRGQKYYQDKIDQEMQTWINKNNLVRDSVGEPVYPTAWMQSHWLQPNDVAKREFISDAYAVISNAEPLKNYYHTMLDIVAELRNITGYDLIRSYNFFPKVRADMIEKLSRSEFSAIHDDLRTIFTVREDEQGFGNYNPVTGEFEKQIPLFFTNPILDAEGKPSTQHLSKDIGASMRLFAKTVFNYKYMNEVEGEILAVKEILPTIKYIKRDGEGNLMFDQHHNVAVKDRAEGPDTTEKVFAAYVDYYLYGIRVTSNVGNQNFTKAILQLRNYFSLKTLGLGFVGGVSSYVAARTSAWMEGQKGILYTKEHWNAAKMDSVNDSKKYHALGYFFGVHNNTMLENIVQGRTKSILADKLYASKLQQYVSSRLLLRPYSYGDERLDNHIAVAMSKNYGVDENGNVKRLDNLPQGTKSIWELFSYTNDKPAFDLSEQQIADVLTQFRLAVRSGQKGVKGTMSDEDIAYSSTDLILSTMMQFKSWMPGVLNERFGKLRYNEIIDAPVWGRYKAFWSELTSTEMEQSAKTSMLILEATARAFGRFGKMLLQNNRISRAAGFGYELDDRRLEIELADYRQKSGDTRITIDQYKKIKAGQLRAMIAEIEVLVLFTSMVLLLGADIDDDGEPLYKDNWVLHQLYRILNRAKTEIAFTYAPSEYAKLISSPIPLAGLALQAERMLTNTLDEAGDTLFGEETERFPIPFGRNKGEDKRDAFYYTLGFIPGGHNLRSMFDDNAVR